VVGPGFPRLLEGPGIFSLNFQGPGRAEKNAFGPGKCRKSKLKFLTSPGVYSEGTTDSTEFCDGQF